jgi:hypothetical protein
MKSYRRLSIVILTDLGRVLVTHRKALHCGSHLVTEFKVFETTTIISGSYSVHSTKDLGISPNSIRYVDSLQAINGFHKQSTGGDVL